jgi:hypothetical protein
MNRSAANTTARVVTAIFGGYVAASGLVALLAVGLPRLTALPRSEAVVLASMLGFVIYLALLLWAFAERKLPRLVLGLALVAAASFSIVALLNRQGG